MHKYTHTNTVNKSNRFPNYNLNNNNIYLLVNNLYLEIWKFDGKEKKKKRNKNSLYFYSVVITIIIISLLLLSN